MKQSSKYNKIPFRTREGKYIYLVIAYEALTEEVSFHLIATKFLRNDENFFNMITETFETMTNTLQIVHVTKSLITNLSKLTNGTTFNEPIDIDDIDKHQGA